MRAARLAAGLTCLIVAACGGGGASHSSSSSSAGAAEGATVRAADCRLWLVLSGDARRRLLAGMRSFFGAPVDPTHGRGQVLTDAHAMSLFNDYCAHPFARAFKLYKLYGRAAAFTAPAQ